MTTPEWNQVIKYIQGKLLKLPVMKTKVNVQDDEWELTETIPRMMIQALPELCKLEDYLAATNTKKERKKAVIDGPYQEEFKKFWDNWPSTRSVPGTQFKSGKTMKKNEKGMYDKYCKIVEGGRLTAAQLNWAAYVYIQEGIEESIRNGRNDLQYRHGMDVFLNNPHLYELMAEREDPKKQQKKPVTNSVDM